MPSVSVVLPTYNRAGLVMEAARSALDQSFRDLEVIVVVDGSVDDTVERLSTLADERLHVIHQDNAGLSAARNAALQRCQGEFIALLDDDDVWLPYKIGAQVALMRANPDAPFVFSEFHVWRPGESREPGGLRRWFERGWFQLDETAKQMLSADYEGLALDADTRAKVGYERVWKGNLYHSLMVGALVLPSTAMVRRDALPAGPAFPVDDVYCGDWAFFARLGRNAPALFMDTETVLNRNHYENERLTAAPAYVKLEKEAAMLQRIWGRDAAFLKHHRTRYEHRLKDVLLRLAKARLRVGDGQGARQTMNAAWTLPGPVARKERVLGNVLAVPGLDRAVRLLDTTRERLLGL